MKYQYSEDLFESTKMTFGEHLEELRVALFKSLIALLVGFLVGLFVSRWIVLGMQRPLELALKEYYAGVDLDRRQEWARKLRDEGEAVPVWLVPDDPEGGNGPNLVFEEVYVDAAELMRGLKQIYPDAFKSGALAELPGSKPVQNDDTAPRKGRSDRLTPILVGRDISVDSRTQAKSLSVIEPFMIYVKAAVVAGAVLASPFVFYFIWEFIAAGLYPHERRYVYVFMPFSLGLFLAGTAVAYFFVFSYVLEFLFAFNRWLGIDPDPRITEWLRFVIILPLGFGISFQLPLVMLFLERIGIFSVGDYISKWRLAVLVIAVIAMVLTPADPYSMLLMQVPLTFLYFGGILLCRWLPRMAA
jgi:sec-independent protein translocase protein TatC